MKYRQKPIEVEAIQYLPHKVGNCVDVSNFLNQSSMCDGVDCPDDLPFFFQTREGQKEVSPGGWVIKTRSGYKALTAEEFESQFEAVS